MVESIQPDPEEFAEDASERLTQEEEHLLSGLVRCGTPEEQDMALSRFVSANLRLVIKLANEFVGRGLAWDDLIAEGNIGVLSAAMRFDPARNVRFSTYAVWWIRQAMRRSIANGRTTVRVPLQAAGKAQKVFRAMRKLKEELGRTPTDPEIAEATGFTARTVAELRRCGTVNVDSLNQKLFDDDSLEGQDLLVDGEPTPDDVLAASDETEYLLSLLKALPTRDRRVLELRFGLNGESVHTLEEVGSLLNCSNERARQIQSRALRALFNALKRGGEIDEHGATTL